MKYALIENGIVDNLIEWDGNTETWTPPEGLSVVECDDSVQIGYTYDGVSFAAPVVIVTPEEIDEERDRRIEGGISYNGMRFQTRPQDRENIHGAATMALAAMMSGTGTAGNLRWHGGTEDFVWISEDNTLHNFDAPAFFAFAQATAMHKSEHIFAARYLKDLPEIPSDFTSDAYWPIS